MVDLQIRVSKIFNMTFRHTHSGLSHDVVEGGSEACRPTSEHKWKDSNSLRPLLLFFFFPFVFSADSIAPLVTVMAFSGTYELESQENYEEFLEAIGTLVLLLTCCFYES